MHIIEHTLLALLAGAEEIKRACAPKEEKTEPLWVTLLGSLGLMVGFLFIWIFAA